ncbi:Sec-independent protein translocase protein tatA/E homolog 3 [Candidatus Moduliflexus flocculans]|uniref:Sec-independent protein translocase protein TatA n=1 Tax=Candidatus Moduliflexus flocculans TaxID=1499966 RepID=A0A081BT17_9BACT|nr:Sec-independent protein translocase protein tatA/E homolog 3 [Candidatus Moduliflexus flocculans]
MFGLGWTEMLLILLVIVVIFGAKRLPEIGSGLGEAIINFKKAMKDSKSIDSKSSDDQKNPR